MALIDVYGPLRHLHLAAVGLSLLLFATRGAALLLAYIVLGSFALKRAPTRRARAACYLAALVCVGWLVSVALAHHPAGAWRLLFTP